MLSLKQTLNDRNVPLFRHHQDTLNQQALENLWSNTLEKA